MRRFALLPVLLLSLLSVSCGERDRYVRFQGYAQGGTYAVTVNLRGVRMRPERIREAVDSVLTPVDTTL